MQKDADMLTQKKDKIKKILKIEEIQFSHTLDKGLKILHHEIKKINNNILSGETVFYLHDTFGFPIDLTEDICREKKVKIDYEGYNLAKEEQKKESNFKNQFYKNYNNSISINETCIFQGYKKNKIKSLVKYIFVDNQSVSEIKNYENGIIFLDKTCFYGESGGQIGDIGKLYYKKSCFIVKDTKKYGKNIGHIGKLISGKIKINDYIYNEIDKNHRHSIELNHSATHLLHSALRKVLGETVVQKGSLVTNENLRFDFSYSNVIKLNQIHEIENIINTKIRNNISIKIKEVNIEEAKKNNAMALFKNQYSSIVRVVSINDFSIELCGGTHSKKTGDIGLFKVTAQSSVASGIKRIEAVTGQKSIDYLHNKDNNIKDISLLLKCNNFDIKEKIQKLILKIKNLKEKTILLQNKENKNHIKKLIKNVEKIKNINIVVKIFHNYEHKSLQKIVDELKKELKKTIVILINIINNNFTIIVGITKNLIQYITATHIISFIIKKTNGKGGGKKEIAEGGGVNTKKLPTILKDVKLWINDHLKKNNEYL